MHKRATAAPAGAPCPGGCYKHYDKTTGRNRIRQGARGDASPGLPT